MMPNLTPPTDSLYKFIALVGLAILLLGLYKSTDAFNAVTKSKIELEDLKLSISKAIPVSENDIDHLSDSTAFILTRGMLDRLNEDVALVKTAIDGSRMDRAEKESLYTSLRKMQIKNESIKIRTTEFLIVLVFGCMLIVYGFVMWYRKEQRHKDSLLLKEVKKYPAKTTVD